MAQQLIISVGREFGSAGHVIAEMLAERFSLPLYNSNLLEQIANEKSVDKNTLEKYDEKPKIKLFTRTVRGFSNSMSENVAQMQFSFLKQMASEGKSFVIVGRCAETILKEYPGLVSIFILGDKDCKIQRIREKFGLSESEAEQMMRKGDWSRKSYHNYYCSGKWGDSRNYDLSINSSKLGLEKSTALLESYIRARQAALDAK